MRAAPTNLEAELERLPDQTGVYIFRDVSGKPIYIGKALSLRNRVRSHFHAGRSLDARSVNMYNRVANIEYILTGSEVESLILESNLIKKYHPEYNIRLMDDKHFPYLRVDLGQDFPRVEVVRRMKRDGARYFGPYTRASSMRDTLRTLRRVFPYRNCSDHKLRTTKKPCLDFHIRRCAGPCVKAITPEDYRAMMDEMCLFLEGRRTGLVARLKSRMEEAASEMKFERAAELRDHLRSLEDVTEKQAIISPDMEDQDVVGYARSDKSSVVAVAILYVREGKVVGRDGFFLDDAWGQPGPEILAAFLKQHYGQEASFIPSRLLVAEGLPEGEAEPIEAWLSSVKGRKVSLHHPVRGPKRHLLDLANKNAGQLLRDEEFRRLARSEEAYARAVALGQTLGLEAAPERVEGYDISNIQGREAVGSMVVFLGGRPAPAFYRRFRVRCQSEPNDYAMMQEVLYRRFRRLKDLSGAGELEEAQGAEEAQAAGEEAQAAGEEAQAASDRFGPPPDLVLIDGGKGHLSAALEVFRDLQLNIPCLALAKEEEMIFLPGRAEPLVLADTSPALHLLRHVRDEAHRFAVGYHRLLRRKKATKSQLDDIPGVGPVRRTALLRAFGSAEAIRKASLEDLAAVPEVGPKVAAKIWAHLHDGEEDGGH